VRAATGTGDDPDQLSSLCERPLFVHAQLARSAAGRACAAFWKATFPTAFTQAATAPTDSEVIFLLLLAFGFGSDAEGRSPGVVALIEHHMATNAGQ
jgi:glutamine amidotransferase